MYKFINKQTKLLLGQKLLFKRSGPSAEPTGGLEKKDAPESKEAVVKLTQEHLDALDNKIKQSHIKFSQKESIDYDKNVFRGKTTVEVNKNQENLRDGSKFQVESRVRKGDKLILTGDYKVLEFTNGAERVYWEVKDRAGNDLYILGESITPIKTIDQNKATPEQMKSDGLSEEQIKFLQKTKQEKETEPQFEHVDDITKKEQPETKTEKQPEKAPESPARRFDRLSSGLTSYKSTRLENSNLQNPDYLKNLLKNDQLSDLQRSKLENSMNTLGLTFQDISSILKDKSNTLPLGELIAVTPDQSESEFAELKKEFGLTKQGRKFQKEIDELTNSKDPNAKSALVAKEREREAAKTQYATEGYKEFMDYYRKSPASKSILVGYMKKTQELAKNPDKQAEFELRYNKLQSILELATTLQNLNVREAKVLNTDSFENINVLGDATAKISEYADINYDRLGLDKNRLKIAKDVLDQSVFGSDEKNLQLLATIMMATNKDLDQLRAERIITKQGNTITLNPDTLDARDLDKLVIGLAYSESQSSSVFKNLFDKDNLTESLSALQESNVFSTARQKMYEHEIREHSFDDLSKTSYLHLNHIFDKNHSGNTISEKGRVYRRTLEDNLGQAEVGYDSTSIIKRYSSELSKYQDLLLDVEENGIVNPQKLVNKFNNLIKLGALGVQFNEELPAKMRNSLKEQGMNARPLTVEDLRKPLSTQAVNLIRYGVVYEELRNDFLKSSDRSPNRLLERAGFSETDPQATYSALATALQYIENGNVAVGGDTDSIDLPNGFKLKGAGAVGVYLIEDPKVTTGASLTIKKDLDKKNTFYVSTGAGFGVGPDTLTGGINAEVGLSSKTSETMTAELAAGGGLTLAGVNVYVRGGLKENRILKDKNERMASGLENVSERKLSKEEITYLKGIAAKPSLSPEDIANAAKFFPGLEETLRLDPALQKVSQAELENFKSNYIQTILRQLNNMTTEQAQGVNWNAALSVGALITPTGAPIPYIIPMIGFEWGGDTRVMKLYDHNNKLTEIELRDQLRKSLKSMPAGTKLQIVSESGYATNIQGKEVVVKGGNEFITNLEIGNPVEKLNGLRSNSGLEFSKLNDDFLKVNIDDYRKVREGINSAQATKVNVYIDPALEKSLKLGHMDNLGGFGLKMNQQAIPENLVILRETITQPSTLGGTTTEVKISFTTRENMFTGSEIEQSSSLYDYISLDKFGRPELNREENNLNLNKLNVNETVSFGGNFTNEEARQLAEYSDTLIQRSTVRLNSKPHKPTKQLDNLVDKLSEDPATMKKLAELTIYNIENGQRIDHEGAAKLIGEKLKEQGIKELSKEDYLYIYGNLLPDTFRSINSLSTQERIEAINKLSTQYVEEYVRSLCKYNTKPNGEKFTEAEQQIIIQNLSKHSGVKESFKSSLLAPNVLTEGAGGANNKLDLNGYNLYTTAHRKNLKGLRNSQITRTFENQIVKGSLTKFDSNTISNKAERDLVNQFLYGLSESIPSIDSNSVTPESIQNPETRKQIEEILNSKTGLLMMSTTPFAHEGNKISLLGAMYGPDDLQLIEGIYEKMDNLGQLPTGMIISNPKAFKAMMQLTKDIQELHNAQGKVTKETYKGAPLELNIKEESGVVLIGKCANPTYLYKRTLGAKLEVSESAPAAAKAKAKRIYNLKDARRENMNRIGFGTKLSLTPKPPTIPPETPDKPNTPRTPDTPDTPPDTPPGETPQKTNTTRAPQTDTNDIPEF